MARFSPKPAIDLVARDWPRPRDHADGRLGGARVHPRVALGGGLRTWRNCSPPDAIAATTIVRRLGVPRRIESILEGESLVNDATALVALQFAVAALVTGSFSLGHASLRFIYVGLGGTALGLLIGYIIRWVQRHLDDPPVANHHFAFHAVCRLPHRGTSPRFRRARCSCGRNLSRLAQPAHA